MHAIDFFTLFVLLLILSTLVCAMKFKCKPKQQSNASMAITTKNRVRESRKAEKRRKKNMRAHLQRMMRNALFFITINRTKGDH